MSTQTYYLWDEAGWPAGSVECDPAGPLPARCTPTPPPAGDVVWCGAWVSAPEPDLAQLQTELRAQATAIRWHRETGGITVGGARVLTGLADQNRIASVLAAAQVSELPAIDFKGADGWVSLALPDLQAIASAITAHVQACFSAERAHHEAIDALESVAEAQAYDLTAGWPEQA